MKKYIAALTTFKAYCYSVNNGCKIMNKYGPKAEQKLHKVMNEFKKGELRSGRSNQKVTSRDQAIAIGLSEAREAGGKVPKK